MANRNDCVRELGSCRSDALEDSQVANTAVKLGKAIISKFDLTNLTGCDDFHLWRQSNCRAKPPFLDSQGQEGKIY